MSDTSSLSIAKQLARLQVGGRFTYPGAYRTNVYREAKLLGIKIGTKYDDKHHRVEVWRKS